MQKGPPSSPAAWLHKGPPSSPSAWLKKGSTSSPTAWLHKGSPSSPVAWLQRGLWIPIYNYLYQKFIYVSIYKLKTIEQPTHSYSGTIEEIAVGTLIKSHLSHQVRFNNSASRSDAPTGTAETKEKYYKPTKRKRKKYKKNKDKYSKEVFTEQIFTSA